MELHLVSFPFLFMSLVVMLFITLIIRKITRSACSNFPPGPWRLPIVGSIHHLHGSLPHRRLRELSQKYGPVMHIKLCERSTIVVSSAEAAKDIYKTHDVIFASRPHSLAGDIVSYGSTGIALSPYGDYWRQIRKICTMELLSTRRVRSYHKIREEEVSNLVKYISTKTGSPINLSEKIFTLTYNIIARAALGERFSLKDQEDIFSVVQEIVKVAGGLNVADLFPSQKWLHAITGERRKYVKMHEKTDLVLRNIISGVLSRSRQGEAEPEGILPVLLHLKDHGGFDIPLTINNVKAVILDIFVGATETSSIVVEWAMSEMLKKPSVLKRAQAEVRKVQGNKGCLDEKALQELEYLKAVIKETLRLHPPLPLAVPRESSESCEIQGYKIPAGTQVFVNIWAILRDPKYWNEPEEFCPERFLDASIDFTGPYFQYKPFGGGKRTCPGLLFALPNVELPLAQLLYCFDWKLPKGTTPANLDMTEAFGSSVRKKKQLVVIPTSYNSEIKKQNNK